MTLHPESHRSIPEIPSNTPAKIAEFIAASQRTGLAEEVVDMEHVLAKPLLGEKGHAQRLFDRFVDEAISLSRGYRRLSIKVFPLPPSIFDREVLRSMEGDALIFDDELAGYNLELLHSEGRGVVAFNLIDDQESGGRGASAGLIMQRDGNLRGYAALMDQEKLVPYDLEPTEAAQVVLSSIAKLLSGSEGLEEPIEELPA